MKTPERFWFLEAKLGGLFLFLQALHPLFMVIGFILISGEGSVRISKELKIEADPLIDKRKYSNYLGF